MKKSNHLAGVAAILMLFFVSSASFALDPSWEILGAKVEAVDYGEERGGYYVLRVKLSDGKYAEQVSNPSATIDSRISNCALTSEHGVVGKSSSSHSAYLMSLASLAMAAQAQGLEVDVMLDLRVCNTNSNYEYVLPNGSTAGFGLGLELRSLRLRQQP